jgi:hypothetical protein
LRIYAIISSLVNRPRFYSSPPVVPLQKKSETFGFGLTKICFEFFYGILWKINIKIYGNSIGKK